MSQLKFKDWRANNVDPDDVAPFKGPHLHELVSKLEFNLMIIRDNFC